tara:strand:+ start:329 stop:658 length:330 start_codon:yes stop_codon:yes gene_type:complete
MGRVVQAQPVNGDGMADVEDILEEIEELLEDIGEREPTEEEEEQLEELQNLLELAENFGEIIDVEDLDGRRERLVSDGEGGPLSDGDLDTWERWSEDYSGGLPDQELLT